MKFQSNEFPVPIQRMPLRGINVDVCCAMNATGIIGPLFLETINSSRYNSFISSNLIHNSYINYIKLKRLYMFRASSAHPQEVNVVICTCMQSLVFSFSAGGHLVHVLRGDSLPLASAQDGHLQRMRIPEAAYIYN